MFAAAAIIIISIVAGVNIIIIMMSTDLEAADIMMCCASCGKAEVDDIKLMTCTACKSVRYCGVKCQRDHRPKHKRACKKRAAELRDEVLFKQPESSNYGDCPICYLPLSIDADKSTMKSCCSKIICDGCYFANKSSELKQRQVHKCPFCRHPLARTDKESNMCMMKRVEANDLVAMSEMGIKRYREGDYSSALEYLTKAAGMGDIMAHDQLSIMYRKGQGVEKDRKGNCTIWKRLPLVGIHGLDTISDAMRRTMVGSREQ